MKFLEISHIDGKTFARQRMNHQTILTDGNDVCFSAFRSTIVNHVYLSNIR